MPASKSAGRDDIHTLYVTHGGWLKGWLRHKLGNAFDAADLAHDTFVNVIKAGQPAEIREPRSFLATIANRLVVDRHRRHLIERAFLDALALMPEALAPSAEARYLALEALREIDAALDGLPLRVKQAFLLCHIEELSYAEIAARLKVSTSSVKQYLTRANGHCLFRLAA